MTDQRAWISWDLAERFIEDAFTAYGVSRGDAEICADVILESDRRGIESHGCNRLKPLYIDRLRQGLVKARAPVEILKEGPAAITADAHGGLGMAASVKIMGAVIEKAKRTGIAMGAVRNSTHFGIAGYYAMMASKEGLIGICGTNTRPAAAPTFGISPLLGTNPLTFAFPTDEAFPFVLDCATCVSSKGKVEYHGRIGEATPEGVAIDRAGRPVTDTAALLRSFKDGSAALLPLGGEGESRGGYKGYGYASVVEILSAALSAGDFLSALSGMGEDGRRVPSRIGHFFIAADPDFFMGRAVFRKTCGDILRELRQAPKAPGHDRIYTAGEKEYEVWQERKDRGVPLTEGVQREFIAIRDELDLPYRFPFETELAGKA